MLVYVRCRKCGLRTLDYPQTRVNSGSDQATAAWNNRQPLPQAA